MIVIKDLSLLKDIPEGDYWYLSTPYTRYRYGHDAAYHAACKVAARLVNAGISIFCPIAHSRGISPHLKADNHVTWMEVDRPLMRASYGLVVVRLSGWQDSRGVGEELDYFTAAAKPIEYIDPLPQEVK